MLKGGIFLDMENLNRNGGYGLRYRRVKDLVEAQGAVVLRANAYMAVDTEREDQDEEYRRRKSAYRERVRREGFHLVLKEVQRFRDVDGETVLKANADLDLAVDALLQADNLDYILLGTGDGDFLRLVRALQSRGKRVDLLSFSNTSGALRREVDFHFSGYLMPGLIPNERDAPARSRGIVHAVVEEKGYAFVTMQTGLQAGEVRDDIFLHITDFRNRQGYEISRESFAQLKARGCIIEFDLEPTSDGRHKAVNAVEFVPDL